MKMKKIAIFLTLLFISLFSFSQSQTSITSANLNLREGPSTSTNVIKTIPKHSKVLVFDTELNTDNWLVVSHNGSIGYVNKAYLSVPQSNQASNLNSSANSKSSGNQLNTSIKYYINSLGQKVQSPTYYKSRPAGATAICRDGTYSFSRSRRGTCSGHGGVSTWL